MSKKKKLQKENAELKRQLEARHPTLNPVRAHIDYKIAHNAKIIIEDLRSKFNHRLTLDILVESIRQLH